MWNFVILVFFTYVFGSFLSFPSWPPPFNFNALAYNPPDYESIVSSIHVQKATFSKHFENLVVGPEAFAFTQDSVYTGLADGRIIEIPIESFFTDSAITPYLHSFAQLHDSPQIECNERFCILLKLFRFNAEHYLTLNRRKYVLEY